jgi:putative PIN family toxin of toxin-antitoxin system
MRVVVDTNTLVSALLFTGSVSRLVPAWQSGRITMVVSRSILEEYLRVLAYPKFRLTSEDVRELIEEEVLPFVETVNPRRRLRVAPRDPDDETLLECAVAGKVRFLVTGDRDLLDLGPFRRIEILTPGDLLARLQI